VIGRDRSRLFIFGLTIAFALGISARAQQAPGQQPPAQQPAAGAGAPAQPPGAQQPRRQPRPGEKGVGVLGEAALARAKTRVMRGTATGRDLQTAPITVQERVTGEYRIDTQGRQGPQSRVYDGKSAWVQMPNGIRDAEGFNAQQITRLADLGLPLNARQRYQNLRSARYGAIDGAPTVVLIGSPAANVVEHLEFDRASGLLLRRTVFTRTPLGQLHDRIDYSDYRDASGIKMPYQVRHATWNNLTTEKFSDITVNAPIDEAQFANPPARQRASA